MSKKILILSGSPIKDGNTAALAGWFAEGALSAGADVEIVQAAHLKLKYPGCTSCRACQKLDSYGCVIEDEASAVLKKILKADIIAFASPLYFFGMSAQLKIILDRMFSLYKWNNEAGTMETPLKGKMIAVIASAFEEAGLDALEKPFKITADYSGMKYASLLIPNAGVSGHIRDNAEIRLKAVNFGIRILLPDDNI